MPAKSQKQLKFFKMMEHNPDIAKQHGMSSEIAKEYTKENIGKKSYKNLPEEVVPKTSRFEKLFKK